MESVSTILIVDDDTGVLELFKSLLGRQGYNVAFAGNGFEALEKATQLVPDLVLLDVMMPGMNGFEICRSLRKDPILAEVPIIIITALYNRESRLQGIEAGADDFISKPFDTVELSARIRTITRLNRYRRLLTANRQLESKIAQLSTLYNIASVLNSTIDLDALLKYIVQKIKELLNVESALILFVDKKKDEFFLPAITTKQGIYPQQSPVRFPHASSIAGLVLRETRALLIQNVKADQRFDKECYEYNYFIKLKSILCIPLKGKDGIFGVLEAVNKKDGEFTEDDQHILEAMADNISVSIEKADIYSSLEKAKALLKRENALLRQSVDKKFSFEKIIGNSDKIIAVFKKAEQVALTDSTLLIYGETGTGKELLARAVHQSSPRSTGNFVPINCGAIPDNLLESELFGHEKGAFTGATMRRIGRFEEANGGTLFLDEIGDMPLNLQVKLLRVLQEGFIQRLGSNDEFPVDIRVIVATHRDLATLVAEEKFRQDLYYRIKVVEIEIPPLRERREDIPLLIDHFIGKYNKQLGKETLKAEDAVLDILYHYAYPGNVRELQHIIESAMILCKGKVITMDALPKHMRSSTVLYKNWTNGKEKIAVPRNNQELKSAKSNARRRAEEQVEALFIKELLSNTNGNVSEAARISHMNRSWLAQMVSRHKIDLKKFRDL